jgi:hypothetical protein
VQARFLPTASRRFPRDSGLLIRQSHQKALNVFRAAESSQMISHVTNSVLEGEELMDFCINNLVGRVLVGYMQLDNPYSTNVESPGLIG